MKFFSVLALSLFASQAFAQICYVDMVDRYSRVVQTFTGYGDPQVCMDGMRECRKAIRMRPQSGGVDCIRGLVQVPPPPQRPNQQGHQIPRDPRDQRDPRFPQDPQQPQRPVGQDATRFLVQGESVLYNNLAHTVIGSTYNGLFALKRTWDGYIFQGISRNEISVTSGCSFDICVGQDVYELQQQSVSSIVALRYDGGYVVKNYWGNLSVTPRERLAVKQGCTGEYRYQICVGNQVLSRDNSYQDVIAIQLDGRVVLKNYWGNISFNNNPSDLIVTR